MTLQLLRSASEASSLFDTHALQARQTERIQIDVSRSTAQLAEAIKQMTASTHEEMRKINETATTLKISLSETSDLRTPSEFMSGGLRALFSFSRDFDALTTPHSFDLHPIVQLSLLFFRLLVFLMRGLLSSPTIMFILFCTFAIRMIIHRIFVPTAIDPRTTARTSTFQMFDASGASVPFRASRFEDSGALADVKNTR
ncbi:hypothetical protein HETIRDRAFT_106523 [Heterobasidion irregulare TC 32-1]|uniref:Uncharacterized protein n=1 Tax=Heterobasidion irregulare (strain TC 32-1) TaxID=747525 RepID=W4JS02_HETIT|nr:uncharacterized protein HETIRDRAFT_106523 [Heterobasidion irregulare TC 32-1]ETW75875.1 hypothetical protein HETIRDRAFT_106523 [Heterobasidion irregulare TC 32-1]